MSARALRLAAALALAAFAAAPAVAAGVRLGMERVFEPAALQKLAGRRIGVLAHHASRDHAGRHLVDLLVARRDLDVRVLFAPEHGFRSAADDVVADSRDPATGLPLYSLYGPRQAPTPELLSLIDVVVIDLQDTGVRYYTYGATVALTLEAAARAGKAVVLLDRPNPVGGDIVEGATLEKPSHDSLAAFAPIPTRHGMTLGELARYYRWLFRIPVELTVVPMAGWRRAMHWPATGLGWNAPSPALPHFDQTALYTVFGALEAANLAVGRGVSNDEAFRVYGAPWINPRQAAALVRRLRGLRLPGLRFAPAEWVATRREYEGQRCRGFRIELTDAQAVRGFESLLLVLRAMHSTLGGALDLSRIDAMLGARWVREGVMARIPVAKLVERARVDAAVLRAARERVLLYR
jgi:uncharacterized protein YbbC (DUF1343 family)